MGLKAAIRALVQDSPEKKSQQKMASELAVEARRLKAEERKRSSFFGQLKELKEFERDLRTDIQYESQQRDAAVEQALAGFQEGQREQELLEQGFHPESTPAERITSQAMQLFSHHMTPWTESKFSSDSSQDNSKAPAITPQSASLEDMANQTVGDELPPPPPPPEQQAQQMTEGGKPANVERIMFFLDSMGVKKETLAHFGVFPEKIDPSRMSMDWAKRGAELLRELQVE